MLEFHRLLVPSDFSSASSMALKYALRLSATFRAVVDVLHVWQPTRFLGSDVLPYAPDVPTIEELARSEAERALERFLSGHSCPKGTVRARVESGDPCDAILRIAREEDFDLIVMGTHGRRGVSHLLLGSVAERIVRTASCPVLTLRTAKVEATQALPFEEATTGGLRCD